LDHGGLGFGTIGSSSVLAISLILLVIYVHNKPVKIQTD
jgi:uncharacterized membrane-anchored protein